MSTAMPEKQYTFADRTFRVLPPVARQERMLLEVIREQEINTADMRPEQVVEFLERWTTRLCAILLIPVDMTQSEKARGGKAAVDELQEWLETSVPLGAMSEVIQDFFSSGQFTVMFQGLVRPLKVASILSGSMSVSVPSPTETSAAPPGSGPTCGSASPASHSNGAGSGGSPSGPFLASPG